MGRITPIAHSRPSSADTCALSLQWSCRLLLELGGHRTFITRSGFNDNDLAHEIGLGQWVDNEAFTPAKALAALRRQARELSTCNAPLVYPDQLATNLEALGELLALSDIELQVLGFCALMATDSVLNDATNQLGLLGFKRAVKTLAALLGVTPAEVEACTRPDGALIQAGLLTLGTPYHNAAMHLSAVINVSNLEFASRLRFGHGTQLELFAYAFRPSPASQLGWEHYSHVHKYAEIAERYLDNAVKQARRGVNILLYGPPGTGKTQLTRLLAQRLDSTLYEVACTDADGDPIAAQQRLCSLRAANSVLRAQPALLVLDEIEDIFQPSGTNPYQRSHKGWINRMLEENTLPCFWLSNSIEAIDPAHIRRFDMVIEMTSPPLAQRRQLLRELGEGTLSDSLVEHLSAHDQMTPAVLERAVRVGRCVSPAAGQGLDNTVRCIVDGTLKAQGFEPLAKLDQRLPPFYSTEWVNTDLPLDSLVEGLLAHPQARLCFYGPPGTGKTAFGHWLAQRLGKPLLAQRVSDLVSPYVGMTERNLAGAFARAEQEGAVLLLDEVDSFLQDRNKARQSWEVTAVNEMLTQMESYRGLFIASTNMIRDLDEASLRRFDLKVHFGYLAGPQVQALFAAHVQALALSDPQRHAAQRLYGEPRLTPGDFAAMARRGRFKPFASADELASALLAECQLKTVGQPRPIGFVH